MILKTVVHVHNAQFLLQDDEDSILQGEKEAEKMIVQAYAALLLAFLSTERFIYCHRAYIFLQHHILFSNELYFLCIFQSPARKYATRLQNAFPNAT